MNILDIFFKRHRRPGRAYYLLLQKLAGQQGHTRCLSEYDSQFKQSNLKKKSKNLYGKVANSRPVYYSILELLGQRSQYTSIKFALHEPYKNLKMCY